MNKQNKISLFLGVLVLTVLIVTSSFAYFQITNTDTSTNTNFTGELEDIEDYGKSLLSGGIEGYHLNIMASDMAPSKIGTHYYGTIDPNSNYNLERQNYEISNVSIEGGVNNENVAYICTSELSITLEGLLTSTKEDGTYYIQEGDGTLYLNGSNLKIDKRQIDLKELISSAIQNEEGIKEYKKTLTYIISKGNPGTLNVDFDIVNRDVVQNDIAGKNIIITLRNSNLQCEVSGRKVYADLNSSYTYRSSAYKNKIVSASFVDYVPSEEELTQKVVYWDLTDRTSHNGYITPSNSVIGWLESTEENPEQYNLYIGSKDSIYATDLSSAFYDMSNLKEIDFGSLNTSETTQMILMFYGYKGTTLDLSTFDTSKVTNMSDMFVSSSANIIFPSNFGSTATTMSHMFQEYQGIELDLRNFDTSKVTNMSYMFSSDSYGKNRLIATIKFPQNFGSSATSMDYMFRGYNGTSLDLSTFDTSKVTNMSDMFSSSSANIIFPSNFGSSATNMNSMFYGYKGTTLDLSNFDTSKVTDMSYMFSGCSNLTTLDLSSFTFNSVTGIYNSFGGVQESCQVNINKNQQTAFEEKFSLNGNSEQGSRTFTPTYVD